MMFDVKLSNGALRALATIGVASVFWQVFSWFWTNRKQRERTQILFFPDNTAELMCEDDSLTGPCKGDMEWMQGAGSLGVIVNILDKAKESIDVCVFVFTSKELGSVLVNAKKRGVRIRVITDDGQSEIPGAQVGHLLRNGVMVRFDTSTFLMHHKFAIIDGKSLLNGSFNWTRNAIQGNRENVILTESTELVEPYIAEFSRLWEMYDPKLKR